MIGLLVKLIVCPSVVLLSTAMFADVYYPYIYQPIIVGLVLAVVGHMMELLLLKRGTFWLSNIMDFIAATAIVYFSAFFFAGAQMTVIGALLTGFLLTVAEYFQHLWLIRTGKTQKAV
ncbi:DUF2512 family protein [Paludifilum halophilum]|uniref:DUF2512 domain-containing protein n=1 Tax=Paludifilum halophilum TaxID=1642702 RepID=A0A235B7G9_9BACL|nr:DUF2512 family protein [Paludifilum halophilum]OYD08253.1 hypothetical protein CHM34_05210 [Paludifilum halophilum]